MNWWCIFLCRPLFVYCLLLLWLLPLLFSMISFFLFFLTVCIMNPLLVFLLSILLLSTGVHSITHDTSFSEGTCRFDMISVAVLSCMQPDKSWKSPSVSCCKALIYAIDELPAIGENGKCCLCRFMRAKLHYPELAATYISCQGKDRAIVAKWSFPVVVCGKGVVFLSCNLLKTNQ